MPHYLSMFDAKYMRSWDLAGREWTLRIMRVEAQELTAQGGRKSKKPIVYFDGARKALVLNKTNAKAIAGMYGVDTRGWLGKPVAVYPTTTEMGGEIVDCIRVRPQVPSGAPALDMPEQPVDVEMMEKQMRAASAAEGATHGT